MCSYCRCSFAFTPLRCRRPGIGCHPPPRRSGPELRHRDLARAMTAAEQAPFRVFHSVADDPAAAVVARWGQELDRALEAVERVSTPPGIDRHGLVVLVATDVTSSHLRTPGR